VQSGGRELGLRWRVDAHWEEEARGVAENLLLSLGPSGRS
jgi:hypothetical protein